MNILTETGELSRACKQLRRSLYVTVDTEFMRETTYWPKLCVVQMASPDGAFIVDAMAPGLSLDPFFDLMADETVLKVFHAARQDIEIVYHLAGLLPHPIFDTQVAAMVCGFGESISYDQLVHRITGARIDKSSRFTDWARRPLSDRQLDYAIADVTHLRDVYRTLSERVKEQGRGEWVATEMDVLTSVDTYRADPENAWKRIKARLRKPVELAVLKEVAAWREREAQTRDVPRARILKDEAIAEIATQQPANAEALGRLRTIGRGFERSRAGEEIVAAVNRALALPRETLPKPPKQRVAEGNGAAVDLLKVLLKMVSETHGVAPKLIATSDELEAIASDDQADVPALHGWRRGLFGETALKLKRGEVLLRLNGKSISLVDRAGAPVG